MSNTNLTECMKRHGRGKKHDYLETPEERPYRRPGKGLKLLHGNEKNKNSKRRN